MESARGFGGSDVHQATTSANNSTTTAATATTTTAATDVVFGDGGAGCDVSTSATVLTTVVDAVARVTLGTKKRAIQWSPCQTPAQGQYWTGWPGSIH